jgi:hypothetical protein
VQAGDHIAAVSVGYGLPGCTAAGAGHQTRVEITRISSQMLDSHGFSIWFDD